MRSRAGSLNTIPENYTLSFISVATNTAILQEFKQKTTYILPGVAIIFTLVIVFTIVGLSLTINPWILITFPVLLMIGSIVLLIYTYITINAEITRFTNNDGNSITIVIIDDEDQHDNH